MFDYPIFTKAAEMVGQWGTGNWGTGMYPGMGMWGGGGFMWLMPIFWLVILGLLIWFVVSLVRGDVHSGGQSSKNKSPLDILNERYARGEIDTEEFVERRNKLE